MALVTWAFMALVLLIVAVLVILKVTRGATAPPAPPVALAPASVVHQVTSVPVAVFDAVGAPRSNGPAPVVPASRPVLTVGGRPAVVFAGAEFSPYSAAARWAVVAALGRFGTFSDLGSTTSSAVELFGRTPTFTFDGAAYRSSTVAFVADELYGASPSVHAPAGFPALDQPDAMVQSLLRRYDATSTGAPAALPFVDVAGNLLLVGAGSGVPPALLQGMTMGQIASALSDPANPIARAVLGTANEVSAAICAATKGQPGAVCASPGVRAAAVALGGG
ncbi:MAG: DUF929 family protein [Acidimicrobiales bacterium]